MTRPLPSAALALGLAMGLSLVASVAAAQPRISATIDPAEVRVGESAELAITISGVQSAPALAIPAIDGLSVGGVGQTMNMELVDGRATSSLTKTYQVTPTRPGRFTIPSLTIDVAGTRLRTQPVTLVARPAGATVGGGSARAPDLLMLEVGLPEHPIYVGQVVTAELRLLVRDGGRVSSVSPPVLEGSAFTVKLDPGQPRQTRQRIDGATYTVVRWPLALSAVSAGEHQVVATLTVTGSLPQPSERRRGLFDDFFGRPEQTFPLRSEPQTVTVLPLPAEGRPADFSGAIGDFRLSTTAEPTSVTVGDPITTRVVVEGNGNFDRVTLPELESTDGWKVYAPKTELETSDGLGLIGKKVFEQAVVPERADLGALPPRRLSYFDPELGRYETLSTEPVPLGIAAAPASPLATRPAPAGPEQEEAPSPETWELAPNRVQLGALQREPRPLALRPGFLLVQALPLVALAAVYAFARRRERLHADLGHQRRLTAGRAVQEQVAAMERAVAAGDQMAFFTAARRAIQERVGVPPPRPAASLTLDEIERTLPDGVEVRGGVRDVFRTADAVAYSGAGGAGEDLASWRTRVDDLLRRLEHAR